MLLRASQRFDQSQGLLKLRVGLSVGWGDIYPARFAGQRIDITDVPDGTYLLCLTADPSNEFVELKAEAEEIGFLGVLAGPLVRSSYRAGRLWAQSMHAKGREIPAQLRPLADASLGFAQAVS